MISVPSQISQLNRGVSQTLSFSEKRSVIGTLVGEHSKRE